MVVNAERHLSRELPAPVVTKLKFIAPPKAGTKRLWLKCSGHSLYHFRDAKVPINFALTPRGACGCLIRSMERVSEKEGMTGIYLQYMKNRCNHIVEELHEQGATAP